MLTSSSDFPVASAEGQHPRAEKCWALIPCAGSGSRSGAQGPKQYQTLAGLPMVLHTLQAFAGVRRIEGTLAVVAPEDQFLHTQPLPNASFFIANCGGSTRAESVFNGLKQLSSLGANAQDWVLVHDAARCLIEPAQIEALIEACIHDTVGGLLALKLPDTLKREHKERVAETIDRTDKWLAQTPQMFRIEDLQRALALAGDRVTDESSAMEILGFAPKLVEGTAQNFKVTYPQDFLLAQAILQARQQSTYNKEAT